jgi:hypothetical protein
LNEIPPNAYEENIGEIEDLEREKILPKILLSKKRQALMA